MMRTGNLLTFAILAILSSIGHAGMPDISISLAGTVGENFQPGDVVGGLFNYSITTDEDTASCFVKGKITSPGQLTTSFVTFELGANEDVSGEFGVMFNTPTVDYSNYYMVEGEAGLLGPPVQVISSDWTTCSTD